MKHNYKCSPVSHVWLTCVNSSICALSLEKQKKTTVYIVQETQPAIHGLKWIWTERRKVLLPQPSQLLRVHCNMLLVLKERVYLLDLRELQLQYMQFWLYMLTVERNPCVRSRLTAYWLKAYNLTNCWKKVQSNSLGKMQGSVCDQSLDQLEEVEKPAIMQSFSNSFCIAYMMKQNSSRFLVRTELNLRAKLQIM